MTEQQLLQLKKEIEQAQQQSDILKGKLDYLMQDIKEKYDCSSIEELEELMKKYEEQEQDISNKIDEYVRKIEEEYEI